MTGEEVKAECQRVADVISTNARDVHEQGAWLHSAFSFFAAEFKKLEPVVQSELTRLINADRTGKDRAASMKRLASVPAIPSKAREARREPGKKK